VAPLPGSGDFGFCPGVSLTLNPWLIGVCPRWGTRGSTGAARHVAPLHFGGRARSRTLRLKLGIHGVVIFGRLVLGVGAEAPWTGVRSGSSALQFWAGRWWHGFGPILDRRGIEFNANRCEPLGIP